jgi:hypothetical protein
MSKVELLVSESEEKTEWVVFSREEDERCQLSESEESWYGVGNGNGNQHSQGKRWLGRGNVGRKAAKRLPLLFL